MKTSSPIRQKYSIKLSFLSSFENFHNEEKETCFHFKNNSFLPLYCKNRKSMEVHKAKFSVRIS